MTATAGIPYDLHNLGWSSFQQLCLTIAREVLDQTVESFLDSGDGGRDGVSGSLILDANIADEVFRPNGPEAGVKFLNWIKDGIGCLVVGGTLLEELNRTSVREWARQALSAGLIRSVSAGKVNTRTEMLQNEGTCRSNDPHVIALAQVSGARLLYSIRFSTIRGNWNRQSASPSVLQQPYNHHR